MISFRRFLISLPLLLSFYLFVSCSYADQAAPNTDDMLFSPLSSDVLINEILPNPLTGGAEFIEIYNHSDRIINLQDLQIARIDSQDSLINRSRISAEPSLFFPKEYRVLTRDPKAVQRQYHTGDPSVFISISNLPILPNQGGSIALVNKDQLIDRLDYNEMMHNPLIKDPKGVSLERKKFDAGTNSPGNFGSAAASVGHATPGYKNSQQVTLHEEQEFFWLSSKAFSPDDDGLEGEMQINYRFNSSGNIANIYIYNDHGKAVRQLCKNYSLATSGVISWDGLSDTYQRLPVGIYFIYIETYNAIDGIRKYRKSCVLTAKF